MDLDLWDCLGRKKACIIEKFRRTDLVNCSHSREGKAPLDSWINTVNSKSANFYGAQMLHASETWPLTKPNLQLLLRNDRAMMRQICNVKPQGTATIRSTELLARIGIEDLDLILKERRLCPCEHMECSNGAVKTSFDIQVNKSVGLGGPRWLGSSWQRGITESGSSQLSTLMIETPGDLVWDLPCMQQASCLEGDPL